MARGGARFAITVLVPAAIAAAQRRRRTAHVCALAATALLSVVLICVAVDEAFAPRSGILAAEAAAAIAVTTAPAAPRH